MSSASPNGIRDDELGVFRPFAEATSMPPRWYVDPAVFHAEQQGVFATSWIPVAREEDLAEPGDLITTVIADDPVVVVRDLDGGLRALSNVCLHRNTVMVEGPGRAGTSLRCPYHLWSYELDGRLRRAPSMEQATGFEPGELCLPSFAVETWQGWVFVNLDPAAEPLAPQLSALDERVAPFALPTLRRAGRLHCPSPWNWKISVENFSESYHHAGVHADTLQPVFPGQKSWVEDGGAEPWTWLDHEAVVEGADTFAVVVVFPTHLFVLTRPSGMVWFRLEPTSVDHTELHIELFVPPDQVADMEGHRLVLQALEEINDEDHAINLRTQQGMGSRFAQPGRVSHLEAGAHAFRAWVAERVRHQLEGGTTG